MMSLRLSLAFVIAFAIANVSGKQYERCQLYRELRDKHNVPADQLATFTCIAYHESKYKTEAQSIKKNKDGSFDHGIFQINDKYWCSPPGTGKGCGVSCAQLKTDDITQSVICAKKVYAETKRLRGNGYVAWSTYAFCNTPAKVNPYAQGC